MTKKEHIVVFSAHTDDFVLGAGGTIKKYTKEGKKVTAVIFSFGEKSHIWLKEDVIKDIRKKETIEAAKVMGCKVIFLDLGDQRIEKDYKKTKSEKKLHKILEHATKLFTHSSEDPHPDHRAVHKITLNVIKELKRPPEVYIFSIWNPVSFKTRYPALYIPVTKTFKYKLKSLKLFKSQQVHVAYPFLLLLFRGLKEGFKLRTWWGEMFYRIK